MDKFLIDPVCVYLNEHRTLTTCGSAVFCSASFWFFLKACREFFKQKDSRFWSMLAYMFISILGFLFFTHTKPTLYFIYGCIWLVLVSPLFMLFSDDSPSPEADRKFWKTVELYFLIRLLNRR